MCNDWIYFSNKEKKNTFFKHFTFSVFHETRKKSTALTDDAGNPVQQIGRGMKFHAGHVSHTDITAAIPVYSGWGFKYPLCLCFSLQLKDNRRNMQVSPHTAWPLVCFAFSHTYEQTPLQKIVMGGGGGNPPADKEDVLVCLQQTSFKTWPESNMWPGSARLNDLKTHEESLHRKDLVCCSIGITHWAL